MALLCRASLVPLNGTTGLRPQRPQGLSSLRSSANLRRRHSSLTSVVRCDVAGHPDSQRVAGSNFKHSIKLASIPPSSLEAQAPQEPATSGLFLEKLTTAVTSLLQKVWKPAVISLLVATVMFNIPAGDALAAQGGGRMGGRSGFSASRTRSFSAPSQSYSAPRPGPSTYIRPSVGYSAPFFAPSPFMFGGPAVYVGGGGGGGGFFSFMLLSVVAVFVASSILNVWGGQTEEEIWEAGQRSSVVRLQVGLMGTARQLQKDLEKMATRADTSSPEGLHYVLQESVLSLLRNPDYCIYGYSTSEVTKDSYEGEQAFNRLSLEERSKFREETLVNVGDVRKKIERNNARETVGSEYIVVTIIAATEGEFKLPDMKSQTDLRAALTTLGSINSEELQAVEILWTPENEEDTLTTKDMLQDYPLLRSL